MLLLFPNKEKERQRCENRVFVIWIVWTNDNMWRYKGVYRPLILRRTAGRLVLMLYHELIWRNSRQAGAGIIPRVRGFEYWFEACEEIACRLLLRKFHGSVVWFNLIVDEGRFFCLRRKASELMLMDFHVSVAVWKCADEGRFFCLKRTACRLVLRVPGYRGCLEWRRGLIREGYS
jgi:hypothetical protein